MLDAKGIIMMHGKLAAPETLTIMNREGSGYWNLSTYKNKEIIFNRLIPTK
jgi:hypothetical protein